MFTSNEGFESINLASTAEVSLPPSLRAIPESSDDGLDPNDFLSQSHHKVPDKESRNQTVSPIAIERLDLTPTVLTGDLFLNPARLSESQDMYGSLIADSFHFLSAESMYRQRNVTTESPLEFLQTKHDSLHAEMKKHLRLHKDYLAEGHDCTQIRSIVSVGFDRLSENSYLLNEEYSRELLFAESLLGNFEKWDKKRSKVLRRVQSIKSEDNKYGLKLAGLLNKRSDIDAEIEDLEARIVALKNSRSAISSEISETSSVLESKSAKYVNLFRDLEKQGRNAISDYLYFTGLPEQDLLMLLRSEPVEAAFAYRSTILEPEKAAQKDEIVPDVLTANEMGVQALELPEEATAVAPDSAYSKGYERGTKQIEKVKKGLHSLVHAVFTEQEIRLKEVPQVDDILNTITEQIDIVPVVELLSYKVEALEDLVLKTSRMSANFHDQGVVWKDTIKMLESKEALLFKQLSEPQPLTDIVTDTLKSSLDLLKSVFEKRLPISGAGDFLSVLLHREMKAVAGALQQLTKESGYLDSLPHLEKSLEFSSVLGSKPGKLSTRITATGYKPQAPITTSAPTILKFAKRSLYTASEKGVKKE